MRTLALGTVALMLAGCALNPAPVPVVGDSWSITDLAGEWNGEYSSADTRRSGSIHFVLEAGRDTAFGDVIMVPALSMGAHDPQHETWERNRPFRSDPRALFIQFVRAEGNRINGAIQPYPAPDCECTLHTSFMGVRTGSRIEGTFITRHEDCGMTAETGKWWAVRRSN